MTVQTRDLILPIHLAGSDANDKVDFRLDICSYIKYSLTFDFVPAY